MASLISLLQKVEALERRLVASPLHKNPQLERLYNLCQKKADVGDSHSHFFTSSLFSPPHSLPTLPHPCPHFPNLLPTLTYLLPPHTSIHLSRVAWCCSKNCSKRAQKGSEHHANGRTQVQKAGPKKASHFFPFFGHLLTVSATIGVGWGLLMHLM